MPEFSYVARDSDGHVIKETVKKNSKQELEEEIKAKGLMITKITEKKSNSFKAKIDQINEKLLAISKVPVSEKIFFTQNLSVMTKAGISLSQALNTLADQTSDKKLKSVLTEVKNNVEKGQSFGASLEPFQNTFGDLFINMIKAGEVSGQLEQVLGQLTLQIKKDHHLKSKVKGAMVYPSIVIVAMIVIVILMFVFVIPQITSIFKELDAELPLPTVIVMSISEFVLNNGMIVGGAFLILIAGFVKAIKTKKGSKIWDKILLSLPIISPILKKVNLARFSRTLSSLMKTDIPITEVFTITSKVLGNSLYSYSLELAADKLVKGVNIHQTLVVWPKLYPPVVTQMIAVGEETGALDAILEQLAIFYEEEVDQTMSNLTATLEPILMLLLGVSVGGIAVAVIMPMYALTNAF